MSWGQLEQLTLYSGTIPKGITSRVDIKKVKKYYNKKTSFVLDGHVNCRDFLENEYGIKNPYRSLIWKDMISTHKEWFVCVNPTQIYHKIWLLKKEYISSFEAEMPRLKLKHNVIISKK